MKVFNITSVHITVTRVVLKKKIHTVILSLNTSASYYICGTTRHLLPSDIQELRSHQGVPIIYVLTPQISIFKMYGGKSVPRLVSTLVCS